jgi:2-oxoglutarate/2-oxoacid ferredoxin oxidoreductase subunit alpha
MEGAEAVAEAMISAGCRFFAGYPMTPFTELLEHMAQKLPAVGGTCMNAESELEAVGMTWGAAATGTRAATGSVGQGLSLMQESLSELCFARIPVVVFNMARGQGDYFQSTRGGGHGDYRHIVLSPGDVQEAVELTQLAFYLADRWRNPVLVLGDYYIGHVQQAVDTAPIQFGELPPKDWAIDGRSGGSGHAKVLSPISTFKVDHPDPEGYGGHLARIVPHVREMADNVEPMVETAFLDGAQLVVAGFGTAARYLRYVVAELNAEGLPIGFIRPITLWPFPAAAVAEAASGARMVTVYELNGGQMVDDVRLSVLGRVPVEFIGGVKLDRYGFGISPHFDVEYLSGLLRRTFEQMQETA